jgi:HEPN domain-containing protein
MSGNLRLRYARTWLLDADQDLRAAENAAKHRDEFEPRQAGFLAQQGAEKALKDALLFAGVEDPGPTHNLAALIAALPDTGGWQTKQRYANVTNLTQMAAQTRYLINDVPVSWEEVQRAIRLAQGIYRSCLNDMRAQGFSESDQVSP